MRQPSGQKASPPWFGGKVNDHSARRQQGQPLPRQHQGRRCVKDQLCVGQRPLQLACRQRLHAIAADLGQVLPLPGRGRYPGAQRPQSPGRGLHVLRGIHPVNDALPLGKAGADQQPVGHAFGRGRGQNAGHSARLNDGFHLTSPGR